ncbi:acyl-CoA thioesterase [Leptolyngbya sp. FACHB-261]|nr:acyl-CoA thioesterase [Leptolyngbya sp. FACHB-261]
MKSLTPEPNPKALPQNELTVQSSWFEYPVRVQPQDTDYSGSAWHGTYVAWMEAARVECLRSVGIGFEELVAAGCDLPVVEMSIRYHRPARLGMEVLVRARLAELNSLRMDWDYQICAASAATSTKLGLDASSDSALLASARVTLVTVDRQKGKIMRSLPPLVQEAFRRLQGI